MLKVLYFSDISFEPHKLMTPLSLFIEHIYPLSVSNTLSLSLTYEFKKGCMKFYFFKKV